MCVWHNSLAHLDSPAPFSPPLLQLHQLNNQKPQTSSSSCSFCSRCFALQIWPPRFSHISLPPINHAGLKMSAEESGRAGGVSKAKADGLQLFPLSGVGLKVQHRNHRRAVSIIDPRVLSPGGTTRRAEIPSTQRAVAAMMTSCCLI